MAGRVIAGGSRQLSLVAWRVIAGGVLHEKKEHGDKVNKLLKWMSSMNTNLNKDGKAQSDGKPSTESTSKPQVNKSNYLIVFSHCFVQQVSSFGSCRLIHL